MQLMPYFIFIVFFGFGTGYLYLQKVDYSYQNKLKESQKLIDDLGGRLSEAVVKSYLCQHDYKIEDFKEKYKDENITIPTGGSVNWTRIELE